jgi:hypothetical protein
MPKMKLPDKGSLLFSCICPLIFRGSVASKKDRTMNDKEKTEFYIAMCRCCLIAEAMKGCSLCRFNIGLAERDKPVDLIPVSIPAQVAIFAFSE